MYEVELQTRDPWSMSKQKKSQPLVFLECVALTEVGEVGIQSVYN